MQPETGPALFWKESSESFHGRRVAAHKSCILFWLIVSNATHITPFPEYSLVYYMLGWCCNFNSLNSTLFFSFFFWHILENVANNVKGPTFYCTGISTSQFESSDEIMCRRGLMGKLIKVVILIGDKDENCHLVTTVDTNIKFIKGVTNNRSSMMAKESSPDESHNDLQPHCIVNTGFSFNHGATCGIYSLIGFARPSPSSSDWSS